MLVDFNLDSGRLRSSQKVDENWRIDGSHVFDLDVSFVQVEQVAVFGDGSAELKGLDFRRLAGGGPPVKKVKRASISY